MSLRVVNLDNRPFYTVVKQIIKKQKHGEQERVEGGWICEEAKGIFIFTNTETRRASGVDERVNVSVEIRFCALLLAGRRQHIEKFVMEP